MTFGDFSIEEVSRTVREITEQAAKAAAEAVEMAITDINKAAEAAQDAANQATSRAEEISVSIKIVAEEATRTAKDAADAAIREASKAAETVKIASQQTTGQADKIIRSAKEWADETTKSAQESAEKAINEANRALAIADDVSKQVISRTEEFSKSAIQMASEAAAAAKEASDSAIREATSAAASTQEALRQAAKRAEDISNLARELAEQATKSAREAADSARKAFEESMARSISRADKVRKSQIVQETLKKEIKTEDVLDPDRAEQPSQQQSPGANDAEVGEPQSSESTDKNNNQPRVLWKSLLGGNAAKKTKEATDEKQRPEEEQTRSNPSVNQMMQRAADATKLAELRARELAKQAGAVRRAVEAENDRNQTRLEVNEQARKAAEKLELRQGTIQIVTSASELFQLRQFERELRQLENFKVLWSGGSEEDGSNIVVSLEKPTALIQTLSELPMVKEACFDGEKVRVTL